VRSLNPQASRHGSKRAFGWQMLSSSEERESRSLQPNSACEVVTNLSPRKRQVVSSNPDRRLRRWFCIRMQRLPPCTTQEIEGADPVRGDGGGECARHR
jgi:hypothetical protein